MPAARGIRSACNMLTSLWLGTEMDGFRNEVRCSYPNQACKLLEAIPTTLNRNWHVDLEVPKWTLIMGTANVSVWNLGFTGYLECERNYEVLSKVLTACQG